MPTIDRIEFTALEYVLPRGTGYGNARGINHRRASSIVSVTTSYGVIGIGEAQGPPGVIREYVKLVTPQYIGKSLYDFNIVTAGIRNRFYHFGAQGHFISSLGALNIAVVDAIGRTHDIPCCDVLGGRAMPDVACYATTGYFTENPKIGVAEQLSTIAMDNFVGVKIKIGAGIASDIARVRTARECVGDHKLLMVDYNGNYTSDVALESLHKIAAFNIHFCEEPLPPADIVGYAALRRQSPIRVAAGEAHYGIHDFKRLIEGGAVDIVEPSLTGGGGFEEMKGVAMLASSHNLRMAVSCWGGAVALHAAVHYAASLAPWPHTDKPPYPLMVEFDCADNPLRDRIVSDPIQPVNGRIAVPTGPGLGVDLIEEAVAQYRI